MGLELRALRSGVAALPPTILHFSIRFSYLHILVFPLLEWWLPEGWEGMILVFLLGDF